jgi:RHS repeat-associated protein
MRWLRCGLNTLLQLVFAYLAVSVVAMAQSNPSTDQGMKPYDSFHGGAIDSISITSGNLFVHRQLYASGQRGRAALTLSLQYNNKGYRLQTACTTTTTTVCDYTWHWQGSGVVLFPDQTMSVSSQNVDSGFQTGTGQEIFVTVYTARTSDGSTHPLADTGNGYRSIDASGILWNGGSFTTAQDRNGMYESLAGTTTDANGNSTSTDSSGNWIDTLGRVIPAIPGPATSTATPPASTASLSSCPNLNLTYQPVTYAYNWNPPGPTGNSPYILCYASVYVRTAFFGSSYTNTQNFHDVSQSLTMLQSVVQPDGSAWIFTYDGANPNDTTSIAYGDLLKIGFPTGGSISYTYATEYMYQGQWESGMPTTQSRSVTSRTVDASDGTGPHTWTYNWVSRIVSNTNSSYVAENTVTDPLGDDTVHQITGFFGGASLYETQTRYYQGSQSSGTLLKTVNTDYSYSSNPFDELGPNVNPPTAINVVPIRVTTIWPNGQTTKEEKDYDSAFTFRNPLWGTSPTGTTLNTATYPATLGTVSARREFGYGSGAPGGLLTETFTTYLWQGNNNYFAANMLDLPATVTVCSALAGGESGDATGCTDSNFTLKRRRQTVSGYDDPARLFASNVTEQHGTPPSSVRGNLTSVARWLNSSGCNPQTAGSCPAVYTDWFDSGEVYHSIDALGNITTHSYDPTYFGAYSTLTCGPTINSVSHCVSATYDFNTGLITSFTDENASYQASGTTRGDPAHTSNYNYDSMMRMISALLPPDPNGLRPETDLSYPNTTTLKRTKKQDGTHSIIDYVYFDGLGRTKQTQLVDPEGDDFVDTTYDAVGRVKTVSNPHRSVSGSTDGITTTYYDAIGRVVQVAGPDGTLVPSGTSPTVCQTNNICMDYSNFPTITNTDQAGKIRRSRTDALNRKVEVDEPGPGANSGGTPGSGSISISGSLYSSTSSGTDATGSVTVSGFVQTMYISVCTDTCIRERKTDPGGTVSITVNGHTNSVNYGGGSTANSIANALITQINGDGGAFAWASGPTCGDSTDCTIGLQARTPGPDYSLSAQGQSSDEADGFTSFDGTYASGSTLTGGVYSSTTYDSGTLTVTVNGFQASAPYSQNQNNTASAMASALASALNASGSPVTASASGTTITMTAKTVGTATDYTVTGSSTKSFTASSTTLSGGTNPGGLFAPYVTYYSYDALGNLTQVNQLGDSSQAARVRMFTYDSYSRILTANNPESGQISYGYDNNGNTLQRTSPAPNQTGTATQTVSYCYDQLNRITGKAYSAQICQNGHLPSGTAVVSYFYDSGTDGIGHLTSVTDQAGTVSYAYDALQRVSTEQRTIAGVSKNLSYTYNLDNSIHTVTYPSGAVLNYSYSTAGRAGAAQDMANNINYVSGPGGASTLATHTPDGSLTSYVNGFSTTFNGISNELQYNPRLQLCRISVLTTGTLPASCTDTINTGNIFDLGYNFNLGTANDGNVSAITNYRDTSRSQSFTYDQLNRLISAQNAGTDCTKKALSNNLTEYWGNSYGYDAWGNLKQKTVTKCSAENLNVAASAINQLHTTSGADYTYDAAGNMTYDATLGVNYTFDPENRINGAAGYSYVYDSDGNRVEKTTGGSSPTGTIYWYMSVGIVAESDLTGSLKSEYVFFGGQRIARRGFPGGAVSYYFSDRLKSASVITDSAGNIKVDTDYYPWGGEVQFVNTDANHYKFTGKERDTETGLDYFGARYYGNWYGRFLTPDWSPGPAAVPYAHLENPQTLNLYSYVDNNPINGIDSDGHAVEYMVAPGGGWGLDTMMSDGTGETTDSGEDEAAIDAENAMITAYNQGVDAYNAQVAAQNAGLGQGGLAGTPDHIALERADDPVIHDKTPGFLERVCDDCYGAERQFHYVVVDKSGAPVRGSLALTEYVHENADSEISERGISAPDRPVQNGRFKDVIGVGSDKPINRYYYSKSTQTFSVRYHGKEYFLSTKIEQYMERSTKGSWIIQANIVVP